MLQRLRQLHQITLISLVCFIGLPFSSQIAAAAVKSPIQQQASMSLDELRAQYPNARFQEITLQQYFRHASDLHQHAEAIVISEQLPSTQRIHLASNLNTRVDYPPPPPADCEERSGRTGTNGNVDVFVNISSDMSANNSDEAVVMYIVIGVIVIAAWIVYTAQYVYDVTHGDYNCGYWWEITPSFIYLSGSLPEDRGNMQGLRIATGFFVPGARSGIALELGQMQQYGLLETSGRYTIEDSYWLLGPTLRWSLSGSDTYLLMEFLGGRSSREDIRFMGIARFGFNFAIAPRTTLGINFGIARLDFHSDLGVIGWNGSDIDYRAFYGTEIGYRF